jgi:hypothetical protein
MKLKNGEEEPSICPPSWIFEIRNKKAGKKYTKY